MSGLKVVIATPHKRLIEVEHVKEIYFPAGLGTIGVFPEHAPLMTTVGTGVVIYTHGDLSGIVKVAGGVAEISGNSVIMLVDAGEEASLIDEARAKRSLERAENRLTAKELGNVDVKRAEAAKKRALARLEAAEIYKKNKGTVDKK